MDTFIHVLLLNTHWAQIHIYMYYRPSDTRTIHDYYPSLNTYWSYIYRYLFAYGILDACCFITPWSPRYILIVVVTSTSLFTWSILRLYIVRQFHCTSILCIPITLLFTSSENMRILFTCLVDCWGLSLTPSLLLLDHSQVQPQGGHSGTYYPRWTRDLA